MGAEYPCHRILYDELAGSGKEGMVKRIFKKEVEDFIISTISCQKGFSPKHNYLKFEMAVFKEDSILVLNERYDTFEEAYARHTELMQDIFSQPALYLAMIES